MAWVGLPVPRYTTSAGDDLCARGIVTTNGLRESVSATIQATLVTVVTPAVRARWAPPASGTARRSPSNSTTAGPPGWVKRRRRTRIGRTNAVPSASSRHDAGRRNAASPADPQPETRNCLLHRGEGKRPHRDRPLTRTILRRHGLAIKKRAEGCGCGAGGHRRVSGAVRERD
jgi:hypothetical protein